MMDGNWTAATPTWANILSSYISSDAATFGKENATTVASVLPPAFEDILDADSNLDDSARAILDFNSISVEFLRSPSASTKMLYVLDQDNTVLQLKNPASTVAQPLDVAFPTGTTSLTACEVT